MEGAFCLSIRSTLILLLDKPSTRLRLTAIFALCTLIGIAATSQETSLFARSLKRIHYVRCDGIIGAALSCRNDDRELSSFAGCSGGGDDAAVVLHYLSADGEANTCSFIFSLAVEALEDAEYLFRIGVVEADTVVCEFQFDVFAGLCQSVFLCFER